MDFKLFLQTRFLLITTRYQRAPPMWRHAEYFRLVLPSPCELVMNWHELTPHIHPQISSQLRRQQRNNTMHGFLHNHNTHSFGHVLDSSQGLFTENMATLHVLFLWDVVDLQMDPSPCHLFPTQLNNQGPNFSAEHCFWHSPEGLPYAFGFHAAQS